MDPITLKKLTEGDHAGKVGVFVGTEAEPAGAVSTEDLAEFASEKRQADFLTEIGMATKTLREARSRIELARRLESENTDREAERLLLTDCVGETGLIDEDRVIKLGEEGKVSWAQGKRFEKAALLVEQGIADGKIAPAARGFFLRATVRDRDGFQKFLGATVPMLDFKLKGLAGSGEGDIVNRVKAMANERIKAGNGKVTFAQALSEIGRENPTLIEQYRSAVMTQ